MEERKIQFQFALVSNPHQQMTNQNNVLRRMYLQCRNSFILGTDDEYMVNLYNNTWRKMIKLKLYFFILIYCPFFAKVKSCVWTQMGRFCLSAVQHVFFWLIGIWIDPEKQKQKFLHFLHFRIIHLPPPASDKYTLGKEKMRREVHRRQNKTTKKSLYQNQVFFWLDIYNSILSTN